MSREIEDVIDEVIQKATQDASRLAPLADYSKRALEGLGLPGVRGGQVIGGSDKIAAYPALSPFLPSNLGATIYHVLGVDPRTTIADRLNRPMPLNEGEPIGPLFTGAAS